jgi:CSLREA domain-containing protein
LSRERSRKQGTFSSLRWLLILAIAATALFATASSAAAAAYTVNSTADTGDATPDGACDNGSGICTLREAIEESNNSTTTDDTIGFASTPFDGTAANGTIAVATNLPSITDTVTIDGGHCSMSADSEPCAGIDGAGAVVGLDVAVGGDGSDIRNLAFSNLIIGISLGGGDDVEVRGSWFGIDLDESTTANGNTQGILINSTSLTNQIGDGTPAGRNLFARNTQAGVLIQAADNNTIVGNYFGTDRAGAAPVAGFVNGDAIRLGGFSAGPNNATGNVVGGADTAGNTACDGACNLIADFSDDGIDLSAESPPAGLVAADSTTIKGNYIGLNLAGGDGNSAILSSGKAGIYGGNSPSVATSTTIGGANAADRNYIGGVPEGIQTGQVEGAGTTIQNNYVGLNPAGTAAVPNTVDNIDVSGPVQVLDNRVGHNGSGTGVEGIYAYGNGTVIRGNILGVGVNGADLPFSSNAPAIRTQSSTVFNTIGGTAAGQGNVIANGGTLGGIYLDGASSNSVLGNFIGTDSTGTADLGNTGPGINVGGTTGSNRRTTIGGIAAGAGNLISNNGGDAIQVTSVNGVEIVGNRGAGNGDLFIELQPPSGSGNTGANQSIQPPTITSFNSPTSVSGTSAPNAVIRLYSKSSDAAGELGSLLASPTANGAGQWTTTVAAQPESQRLVATQAVNSTDAFTFPQTSELSLVVRIDTIAPVITIDSAPSGTTSDTTPTVAFTVDDASATTSCQVDSGPVEPCSSPQTFGPLADGPHTITVLAADLAGNQATEPVNFTIASAPVTVPFVPSPPATNPPAPPKKKCKKGFVKKKVKGKKRCVKKKKRK